MEIQADLFFKQTPFLLLTARVKNLINSDWLKVKISLADLHNNFVFLHYKTWYACFFFCLFFCLFVCLFGFFFFFFFCVCVGVFFIYFSSENKKHLGNEHFGISFQIYVMRGAADDASVGTRTMILTFSFFYLIEVFTWRG